MLERSVRLPPEFESMNWQQATPSSILARIKEAGIVGMGGAGYSTAAKLASGRYYGTQQVIANGVECEPNVNADRSLMRHYLSQVIEGLRIVGRCLDCDQLTLAVSDRQTHREFQSAAIDGVTCEIVDDDPANGEERVLVQTLFGKTIPAATYPSQHGFVVLNVATLFAICEAVCDGYRPTDRVISVIDNDRWVTINTPIQSLDADSSTLRQGSVATGVVATDDATVTLTTNAIARDHSQLSRACIHCGWCDDVCPRSLPVESMLRSLQSCETLASIDAHVDACFECGACVVACPSQIPLLDWIRQGKFEANVTRLKQRARVRFERRNKRESQRVSEEETAREARIQSPPKW